MDKSYIAVSKGVYYSNGDFLAVSRQDVDFLKTAALASPSKRARLCFHSSPEEAQQEMLIVMLHDSYVRPHRHPTKVETLCIIEGSCEALLFDDSGDLVEKLLMTPPFEESSFFYRMPQARFHSLLFHSEWVVFVETTIGPFNPSTTDLATWAPSEKEPIKGLAFLKKASASLSLAARQQ